MRFGDILTSMETSDTAVLDQDTGLSLPETPSEAPLESGQPSEGNGEVVESPETESDATETPESRYDPDEVFEDPAVKAALEKKLKWERDKAEESFRQKREREVAEAKSQAETEAEARQYQENLQQAAAYFGGTAAQGFESLVRKIAEDGIPDGWNPGQYFKDEGMKLFEGARSLITTQSAQDRIATLGQNFPEWKASSSLNTEWTRALTARDPRALDEVFMKAVEDATRQKVKAEAEAEASKTEAQKKAEQERTEELKRTEEARDGFSRPATGVPAKGRKLMTPEALDKIPMREWESYSQAERDDMIKQVEQYRKQQERRR